MVLVDLIAWTHTTQSFLINRQVSEMFVSTLTLRESAIRLASLVGYRVKGPSPATVLTEASISSVSDSDVVISAGSPVRSSAGIQFETVGQATITAGELTPTMDVAFFSITSVGQKVIVSQVTTAGGSSTVDLVDTTIDLTSLVLVGQTIRLIGSTDTSDHVIQQVAMADGAVSNNRMIVDPPISGSFAKASFDARVFESRITLSQGQTITEKFLTPSTTQESYIIKLGYGPVIDGSVLVSVNGVEWAWAASLYEATSTATAFAVRILPDESTILQFGNGQFGQVVPIDSTLLVSYRVGGGTIGNVRTGAIDTSITGLVSGSSNPVVVKIANLTASGQGGQDKETVEQLRDQIPASVKANNRAVTLEDYETLAAQFSHPDFGSVSFARANVKNANSLLEGNIVVVYAWTTGPDGGLVGLSPQLSSALKDFLDTKAVVTDLVLVSNGTSRPVPVSLQFKASSGYNLADTQRAVEQAISTFVNSLKPGSQIIHSSLLKTLDATPGVDHVDLATPINNLVASSPDELFTAPQADFIYSVDRVFTTIATSSDDNGTISQYTAQLPVFPVATWSVRLFMGGVELAIVPDSTPGFARMWRPGILSVSSSFKSTLNLLTGKVTLYVKGSPGALTMKLVSVQCYDKERNVDLFIGFVGANSQSKRREIRSAIRTWSQSFSVGAVLYAQELAGVIQSKSNVESVVLTVPDVTGITRISLGSPGSTDVKITPSDSEIIRISSIILNNSAD